MDGLQVQKVLHRNHSVLIHVKSFCLHKVSSITPCQSLMYVQYVYLQLIIPFKTFFHFCCFLPLPLLLFFYLFSFLFLSIPYFKKMNTELYTSLQLGKPDLDSITSSTLHHIKSGVNYLSKRGSRTNKRDSRTCKRVFRTRNKI